MRQRPRSRKLVVNKESVRLLTEEQLRAVVGGLGHHHGITQRMNCTGRGASCDRACPPMPD